MRVHIPVLAIALVLITTQAFAQTPTWGARIGVDLSSLPNAGGVFDQIVKQTSTESSSKGGPVIGGFAVIALADGWALQPELQFVAKGVSLTEAAGGGTFTARIRYLEFPVLMRYGTSVGTHDVHLLAGPTFAVKAGTSGHLETPSQSADFNIDSAIRTLDVGLAFAAELDYRKFFVEGRYTQGLRDVASETFPHTDSIRNRAFAVTLGMHF